MTRRTLLEVFPIAVFSIAVAVGCSKLCPQCPQCAEPVTCPGGQTVELSAVEWDVDRVVDGDTVVLQNKALGLSEKVRLLRINTPERGKAGFEEASDALRQLLAGKKIRVEFETPGVLKRGRYGRLLAYLYVGELNVNLELVRLGWTPFWTKYGFGRMKSKFEQAEREARGARLGLWGR